MRSRNIKPSFYLNDRLAACSPHARLLFIGLWCAADWEGRLQYRPARLRAELFPYEQLDIEALIKELVEADKTDPMVVIYGDGNYLHLPNFTNHQNPHKNERAYPSKCPAPDCFSDDGRHMDGTWTGHGRAIDGTTRADSLLLIPDSLIHDPDSTKSPTGSGGKEGKRKKQKIDYSPILEIWRSRCVPAGLPEPLKVEGKRKSALERCAKDPDWMAILPEAIEALLSNPFNTGDNDRGWRADIDYFTRPGKALELVEKYRAGKSTASRPLTQHEREAQARIAARRAANE